MPKKAPPTRHPLRLIVLNDSSQVLKMLCGWLQQHGHHCDTGLLADMPNAHEDVPRLILKHRPDVVVYDVAMPYASSWDLLDVIRASPALQSQIFVITTPNKQQLEQTVGPTSAIEIAGHTEDLRRLLKAVERAANAADSERS